MRISDWSSDVCSSDLPRSAGGTGRRGTSSGRSGRQRSSGPPRRARPVLLAQGRDGGIVLRPADVRRRGAVGPHAMASEHNEQMSGGQQADPLVLGGRGIGGAAGGEGGGGAVEMWG